LNVKKTFPNNFFNIVGIVRKVISKLNCYWYVKPATTNSKSCTPY